MTLNRSNAGAAALGFARELTGRPYVWGGTWPASGGTDCSGLWDFAYGKAGIFLPRTTYGQYLVHQIPNSWPSEPGDLLFIAGSDAIGAAPGHVMGYVSPGQVFQAEYTGGPPIGQFPYDTSKFEYRTRPALALAPPAITTKNPNKTQLTTAGLVPLANPAEARIAITNGWLVYYWAGNHFAVAAGVKLPKNTPEYASTHYKTKHR